MATVDATAITRIHNVEGALTLTSIGGGAGGGANTEIFIQGAQSAGRKQSNVADHGFWLTVGSQDVSPAGIHVGVWINHIHYAVLTLLRVRLGSTIGAATAGNWDGHNFPLTSYPKTGGWVRFWINVDRTPEATGDSGGLVQTALIGVAVVASLPAVGGNAPNIILDAQDFTTTGLLLTGTTGVFQDFLAADEDNGTNKYGVVISQAGVIFCLARLTLGSASSLVFNDSGFVVVFPNQTTVASTFMGVSVDLQVAATNIDWANGVLRSAGATKGDLVVTGTAGAFDVVNSTLASLRVITLTSACTLDNCLISESGLITAAGAIVKNSTILKATGTAALFWNTATDTDGKLDGNKFTMGTAGHGIELGSSTPATITLRNITFTGYGADGTTDAALYNNTGGARTVNIVGGTTPTVRNGTGASTTLVINPVDTTITVKDIDTGAVIASARVLVTASDNTGPMPFNEDVTSISRVGATATVMHTAHGLVNGKKVLIKGANQQEYNGIKVLTFIDNNSYSYTVSGTPDTPATGAIKATGVVIDGDTDINGVISDTRSHASNQPITGRIRKATGATLYKTGSISGTVNNTSGFAVTVQMIKDQ